MVETITQLEARYDGFHVPTFEISLGRGGTELSPARGHVSRVRVQTALDRANRVSFSVGGVYDRASGTFAGLDESVFRTGTRVAVEVGYGSATEPVLVGEITSVRPRFPSDGAPTVDVTGHDYRFAMAQATHDESWDGATVSRTAERVLAAYEDRFEGVTVGSGGPGGSVAVADETFEKLFQSAQSDYQFLRGLADRYGYELFSRAGHCHFRRPPASGEPAVELRYGRSLRSFTPAQPGGSARVGSVEVRGYDPTAAEPVSGTAEPRSGGDGREVIHAPVRSTTEARQRAQARAQELDRRERGRAETLGLPELRVGEWLGLTGLGGAGSALGFDGTYYVHEVTHAVDTSGYSSSVTLSHPTANGDNQ